MVQTLVRYLELLAKWGQTINLISRVDPPTVTQRHLPDAFFLARHMEDARSVLDVGSGAGIPGLVIALLFPNLRVQLIESNQRRCSFLRTAIHRLDANASVIEGRLEHEAPDPADLVCSRATWPPAEWVDRASSLVRPGGRVATYLVKDADLPRARPPLTPAACHKVPYRLTDGTPRLLAFYRRGPS
jgi:16S rRNA (guanine527-N7)-methyltransferase